MKKKKLGIDLEETVDIQEETIESVKKGNVKEILQVVEKKEVKPKIKARPTW